MARRAIWFGAALASVSAVALFIVSGRHQQAPGPDLDSVLVFADPGHCRPGQPLATILSSLMNFDERGESVAGRPVAVRGFAEPLRPRIHREFGIGRDAVGNLTFYTLDLPGKWHGLNVVSLRTIDGESFEIRFSDHPAMVRDTLVRAGFPLPAVDQWHTPDYRLPDPGVMMSVHAHRGGGASLMCGS